MRLLNANDLFMREFVDERIPPYVIVSHRWEKDEITYQDFETTTQSWKSKRGFHKIKQACRLALEANCSWIWLDTCCIDKRNSVELNEAINAMYKWYQNSAFCIAYLFDHEDGVNKFSKSTWFKRCWTLQELIAPREVEFYDSKWRYIGSKEQRRDEIAVITRIDKDTLSGSDPKDCSIAQRMSWAAERKASRIEDEAYSLLGLFGLSMPTLYGSGDRAFQSLQEELLQRTDDQSIFAWDEVLEEDRNGHYGLLAQSPAAFASCHNTTTTGSSVRSASLVGGGVELDVLTIPYTVGTYLCALDCTTTNRTEREAILLEQLEGKEHYARLITKDTAHLTIPRDRLKHNVACKRRTLYVRHLIRQQPLNLVRGFWIRRLKLPGYDAESRKRVRICSRLGGEVYQPGVPDLVQLSDDSWGTAGLIYAPVGNSSGRWHLIRWIKLGFDADFCPVIQLGNKRTIANIDRATVCPPKPETHEYDDTWNSDWLLREEKKRTKRDDGVPREYDATEYFQHRGYTTLVNRDPKKFTWNLNYLRLKVTLSLQDLPASELPLQPSAIGPGSIRLSACGPGPWKIWTVDIVQTGTYASKRERMGAIVAGVGLLAVTGAVVGQEYVRREGKVLIK